MVKAIQKLYEENRKLTVCSLLFLCDLHIFIKKLSEVGCPASLDIGPFLPAFSNMSHYISHGMDIQHSWTMFICLNAQTPSTNGHVYVFVWVG